MDIGPMKLDAVGPRRDLDSYVGFRRRLPVVLRQSLADLGGPHPDDGIFRSVVIGDTSKHLDADDPLLQQFILTFVAVFHHRAEKFSTLVALAEGRARQFFIQDGRRYGHILDPRTGWPARGVYSASAIAPTATEADALSTAFYVMGFEATRQYCREHTEVGAVMVVRGPSEGTPPRVHVTGAVEAEVLV